MSRQTQKLLWRRNDKRSLLQIALDVHMTHTGSMERADAAQFADVEVLRLALRTWVDGPARTAAFDGAVRSALAAAVDEAESDGFSDEWVPA